MSGKVSAEIRREVSQVFKPVRESVEQQMTSIQANAQNLVNQVRTFADEAKQQYDQKVAAVSHLAEEAKSAVQETLDEISSASQVCAETLQANRKTMIRVAVVSGAAALLLSGVVTVALIYSLR